MFVPLPLRGDGAGALASKRTTGALVVGNNEEAVPGGETRKNRPGSRWWHRWLVCVSLLLHRCYRVTCRLKRGR